MGKVYLVGAGPGDEGLLTLKAQKLIENADVIVYDRLAGENILNFASEKAEKIYVGKASSQHTMKQTDINQLLVKKARENNIVVRLKGGDPFVFGRGGEEALTLEENKIPFEVVPGVTSAIAVAAYAGIPVTHRGVAKSFAVITGHEMSDESNIRWDKLATAVDTIIILMGVENLQKITQKLIENGRDKNTPAAVIQWGTKPNQRVLITTIANAAADVKEKNLTPPAIFVVGDVVKLRDKLKWYEIKPLFGKKILVTRAREQASKFSKKLKTFGATCLEIPTIKIVDPSDKYQALDSAINDINSYEFIIFTSVNGVKNFFERLKLKNLDSRALYNAKIVVIGKATAEKLSEYGVTADFMPKEFRAESVLELLKDNVEGKKVLIARAEEAREILPEELKKYGAKVEVVSAYKTISDIEHNVEFDDIDMITFTSSSTVKNFVEAFGITPLKKSKVAVIGPITESTLKSYNINADIVAEEYTIDGLIQSILNYISMT